MDIRDMREIQRAVSRAIHEVAERLERKLMLVANKAVVELVRDGLGTQGVQVSVLAGEVVDAEHMQPGGLTHRAPAGAEGVFLTIGGARDDGVVLCVSSRAKRPGGLGEGETALYNASDNQSMITIRANGDVEVNLADGAKLNVGGAGDFAALASLVGAELVKITAALADHAAKLTSAGFTPDPASSYTFNPLTSSVASEVLATD